MWENHLAQNTMCPTGGVANAFVLVVSVCVRVQKLYRPITTCSNCSVIFPEHAHIHSSMETAQHNIEGTIIYYNIHMYPDPDLDTYERRHSFTLHQGRFLICQLSQQCCLHVPESSHSTNGSIKTTKIAGTPPKGCAAYPHSTWMLPSLIILYTKCEGLHMFAHPLHVALIKRLCVTF